MAEVELLRLIQITEKSTCCTDGILRSLQPGILRGGPAKLCTQPGRGSGKAEALLPCLGHGPQLFREEGGDPFVVCGFRREKNLTGAEAAELIEQMADGVSIKIGAAHLPCRQLAEGGTAFFAAERERSDVVAAVFLQHGALRHGAGSDHTDDFTFDKAFGQSGVFHLLADGDFMPFGNQPGNVGLRRVVGHTAHRGAFLRIFHVPVSRGQGDVQITGGCIGIVVKQLVEVTEAEKKETVLILILDFQVLSFHGSEFCHDISLSNIFIIVRRAECSPWRRKEICYHGSGDLSGTSVSRYSCQFQTRKRGRLTVLVDSVQDSPMFFMENLKPVRG